MTDDIATTTLGFSELILELKLYDWQAKVLYQFEKASGPKAKMVKVALKSPNGAGKSSHIVAALSLWWLSIHKCGKVVITTCDSKQLNEQIHPALLKHKDKFQDWDWNSATYIRITSPTGGVMIGDPLSDR